MLISQDKDFLVRENGPGKIIYVVNGFAPGIDMETGEVVVIKFLFISSNRDTFFLVLFRPIISSRMDRFRCRILSICAAAVLV